jgi:hypothetical protein
MVGASKILTVSYGTFSCTLEGFDDPFNTMRAIAEYFRDLAAEDRYFGAEPPTPDAAMLHRIAEREVQRRVEARVQDNGVILRAGDAGDVMRPAAAPAVEPEAPAASRPVAVVVPVAAPSLVADLDSVLGNDAPAATVPGLNAMPDGVAARLAKIRAAVALAEPDVAAPVVVALSDFTEDQHSDEAFAPFDDVSEVAGEPVEYAEVLEIDAIDAAAEAADIVAPLQAGADLALVDLVAADPVETDLVTADLVEADLAAADLASDLEDDDTADLIADLAALDDAMADGMEPDDSAAVAEAVSDDSDDSDSAMLANLALLDETDADDAVSLDSFEDDFALPADEATEAAEMPVAADLADEGLIDAQDDADDLWAGDDGMPSEPVAADDTPEDMPDDLTAGAALAAGDIDGADAEDDRAGDQAAAGVQVAELGDVAEPAAVAGLAEPGIDTDAPERAARARVRVIRVRRSTDIAIDRAAAADVPAAPSASPVAPLPDEAEAELQRDLASLEAELAAPRRDAQDADDDLRRQMSGVIKDAADADAALRRDMAAPADETDPARDSGVEEDAVRRLMDQTKSEMAVPENRRRLSSIAHLKAAVAATIADRFGTKPKPVDEVEANRTEPYRNDLARSVRPARPAGPVAGGDRPAPLVLVSEQRIDRPATPVAVTPVRPRRLGAQTSAALQPAFDDEFDADAVADGDADTDNIFGDAKGFVEFADRVGASGLPELLEAAAAYAAAVEGRDSFTRPQLLRQISHVTGAGVTREDELRSFGTLLRDGRIIKVKRGEFALTETSPLLVEARKIAG